ncbi:fluoride efflux transporter CrcB [Brevibacterium atlanticum]|uniref:fluoride efflux transporter CrcB n=1 Tax=Brevibacterium atlanticum TaxID=2697563 RepID=UPI001421974E|nr:fluoride efflux transporter CrcB [Brevibacterium atlanticum]
MSVLLFSAIAVAGGLGAGLRMILDGLIKSRTTGPTLWGTIVINVSGSLVLGFLTGLAAQALLPESWHLVIGTGFLGGYTTFSTASVETVRLLQERKWAISLVNGLGTLIVATAAAGSGLWLGGIAW